MQHLLRPNLPAALLFSATQTPARGVSTEKRETQQNSSAMPCDSCPGEKQTNRGAGGWGRRGPLTYVALGRHLCADRAELSTSPRRGTEAREGRRAQRRPGPRPRAPTRRRGSPARPPREAAARRMGGIGPTAAGGARPAKWRRPGEALRSGGRRPELSRGRLSTSGPGLTRPRRLQLRPGAQLLPAAGLLLPGPPERRPLRPCAD